MEKLSWKRRAHCIFVIPPMTLVLSMEDVANLKHDRRGGQNKMSRVANIVQECSQSISVAALF
jgi:hypothetical protein